ncbi:hypothetical protein ACFFRL_07315 [Agromyces hippuratus]|uniref:hypothetical protein n=1 Tax=Agromyces hippuratus TaxID=286438 RepID=UPI0035E6FEF9
MPRARAAPRHPLDDSRRTATVTGMQEAGRRTPLGARPLGAANIGARGYCGRPRQF